MQILQQIILVILCIKNIPFDNCLKMKEKRRNVGFEIWVELCIR